jgi:hypothetical protein
MWELKLAGLGYANRFLAARVVPIGAEIARRIWSRLFLWLLLQPHTGLVVQRIV